MIFLIGFIKYKGVKKISPNNEYMGDKNVIPLAKGVTKMSYNNKNIYKK